MEVTTKTEVSDEKLIPKNINLLRPNQIQMMESEVNKLEDDLASPSIQMKGRVRKQLQAMKQQLDQQRPRIVKGAEKDRVAKRVTELVEDLRSTMLTKEEMVKAPPGAPDYLLRWEHINRHKVTELKNGLLMLGMSGGDYTGYETDIANLEKFRPERHVDRYDTDALTRGHLAMSPLAKFNWPLGEPTADTALKQAERVAEEQGVKKDGRSVISDERRAQLREALAKGRAAQAAKKAAIQQPSEMVITPPTVESEGV